MVQINCVGILVVDALSGPLKHYPIPGKVAAVITPHIQFLAGGGAANTASALAQMGIKAGVFSKVGQDLNGRFLISELKKMKVQTAGINVSENETTPFTFVGIHSGGERTFVHTPGTNLSLSPKDIDIDQFLDAEYVLFPDHWVFPKLDGKPIAEIFKKARKKGVLTFLDESWGLGPNRKTLEAVIPFADYFLPSYHDLLAIYPGKKPEEMIACLKKKGAKKIVLKMGAAGCLVAAGNQIKCVPSRASKIVDATGAGDCFNAGFMAGLLNGYGDDASAEIGALSAAACLKRVGGAVGIPAFKTLKKSL